MGGVLWGPYGVHSPQYPAVIAVIAEGGHEVIYMVFFRWRQENTKDWKIQMPIYVYGRQIGNTNTKSFIYQLVLWREDESNKYMYCTCDML